ncbi:MAG TPA: hypothetical protein VFK03_03735, partial [Candidatus Saccharimonadales bacterium]|nr:hypothetical protein [Candidatus Saccharimonadales bacterium]
CRRQARPDHLRHQVRRWEVRHASPDSHPTGPPGKPSGGDGRMSDKGKDGRYHGQAPGNRKQPPRTFGGQAAPPKADDVGRRRKLKESSGRRK